jgi:DNA-binding NarL/FixJ family response regulator
MNIKIAIADDHPMIIDGLQSILLRSPHITLLGSYPNGEELLKGLKKAVPDVLLLDIQLPGKTGDELTPIILKKYPKIKILTLTNFDNPLYASNMLKIGAHGYLLKTADKDLLIQAIETVYNGEIFIEDAMREEIEQVDEWQTLTSKVKLTQREKEILQLIANGLNAPEIADTLCLSLSTVRNYRNHLLRRLEVHNTASLVQLALKMGLVK